MTLLTDSPSSGSGSTPHVTTLSTLSRVLLVLCRGVSAPPPQRPARPAPVVLPAGQVGYLLPGDPRPKQRVRVQCLLNVFSSTTTRPCSIMT